jgi:hypothetical protein
MPPPDPSVVGEFGSGWPLPDAEFSVLAILNRYLKREGGLGLYLVSALGIAPQKIQSRSAIYRIIYSRSAGAVAFSRI